MTPMFTPLEIEILECLASFWSIEEISLELKATENKIRCHVARLRRKLDIDLPADARREDHYEALCRAARHRFQTVHYYALATPEGAAATDTF